MREANLYLNVLMITLALLWYNGTLALRHATNTYEENVANSWMISRIKQVKILNYVFIFSES